MYSLQMYNSGAVLIAYNLADFKRQRSGFTSTRQGPLSVWQCGTDLLKVQPVAPLVSSDMISIMH